MLSFVDAFFGEANLNATKAYMLSAYQSKGNNAALRASELMAHPLIRAEVERRQTARAEKSELTGEYLIQKLLLMIEREEISNPQAALRAIELAGKSIALWKERQEISGPDGQAIKHEQHVKESVADFTNRIQSLASRAASPDDTTGTSNVVGFPQRRGEG